MNKHIRTLLLCLFASCSASLLAVVFPQSKPNYGILSPYIDSLSFNGKRPIIDPIQDKAYVNLANSQFGSNSNLHMHVAFKDSSYRLFINGLETTSNADFRFSKLSTTQTYVLSIKQHDKVLKHCYLYFSSLPFVELYSDSELTDAYQLGRINVIEPEAPQAGSEAAKNAGHNQLLLANLKIRGNYAAKQAKKSFSIKLKDNNGSDKLDRRYFGLRNDNNWILDAMAIDKSRMRNRVSTDLWNEFATKPYWSVLEPNMRNGTRGQYVEVFINNSYNGLYCMTERIDRKQLNLKKYTPASNGSPAVQRGALYKADSWTHAVLMCGILNGVPCIFSQHIPNYSNTKEKWAGYENEYPDLGDGEPIDWAALYQGVRFCSSEHTNDDAFRSQVASHFDLPLWVDYYLFIELMLSADNQAKNSYLAIYDQRWTSMLSIVPWDMDATWGRRWNGSSTLTYADQDFDAFVSNYEHGQNNLFLRLKATNAASFNDRLEHRYQQLRATHFSYDALMRPFRQYYNLLTQSGAAQREIKRWDSENFASIAAENDLDLGFIGQWIAQRLTYLDNQYLGGPFVALSNPDPLTAISLQQNPVFDAIILNNIPQNVPIRLQTLHGQTVFTCLSTTNQLRIPVSHLPKGVYLLHLPGKTIKVIKQ